MSRRSNVTARRAGLVGVALAAAGGLAVTTARLTRGRRPAATRGLLRRRSERNDEQRYTCDCGAVYRVSGTDRHRVYWPDGAAEDAPVLGDRCVQCDAPLPSGRVGSPA